MGNKNLTPDQHYLIRDFTYQRITQIKELGIVAVYKKNKSNVDLKLVKHLERHTNQAQESDILKVLNLAKEVSEYSYFYDSQWTDEKTYIRACFDYGTLPFSELLDSWTEIEGLNLLNFLCKAGSVLEEKGLFIPDCSPERVFITATGPRIPNPFLYEGFINIIANVNF